MTLPFKDFFVTLYASHFICCLDSKAVVVTLSLCFFNYFPGFDFITLQVCFLRSSCISNLHSEKIITLHQQPFYCFLWFFVTLIHRNPSDVLPLNLISVPSLKNGLIIWSWNLIPSFDDGITAMIFKKICFLCDFKKCYNPPRVTLQLSPEDHNCPH